MQVASVAPLKYQLGLAVLEIVVLSKLEQVPQVVVNQDLFMYQEGKHPLESVVLLSYQLVQVLIPQVAVF